MTPEIVSVPDILVACLEHRGSPAEIMKSVLKFVEWRKSSGEAPPGTTHLYGIPYGDPSSVAPENFRHDICASIARPVLPNDYGVVTKTIPAGRCATIRHVGSTNALKSSITALHKDWLPGSGEKLRDFPCYLHFVQRMPAVSEAQQITDIYLPLR